MHFAANSLADICGIDGLVHAVRSVRKPSQGEHNFLVYLTRPGYGTQDKAGERTKVTAGEE